MVSGNPYISVNRATTKALKAPMERHSHRFLGLRKLRAKKTNMATLMATTNHIPYAYDSMSTSPSILKLPSYLQCIYKLNGHAHHPRACLAS